MLPCPVIRYRAVMLFFGICSMSALHAQGLRIDTIRAVRPWGDHEVYTFPKVIMPDHPAIAAGIEKDLCTDLLEVDPDTVAPARLFENVWGDGTGRMPRLSSLQWTGQRPFPNVLVFTFEGEGCGAYCEGFTKHYHFDLRSGEALDDAVIFTAVGHDLLKDTLRKNWSAQLTGFIERAGSILYQDTLGGDEQDALLGSVGMYRSCLEERDANGPYIDGYTIDGEGLRFFIARCAAHAELPLDALDPVSISLPLVRCLPWMHERYRALFTGPD